MTMPTSLSSFVTLKTESFFQKIDTDEGFLATDPALWEEDNRFKDARKRVLSLRVVNDATERGHRPSPALPKVHKVGRTGEIPAPVSPPPLETCGVGKEGLSEWKQLKLPVLVSL